MEPYPLPPRSTRRPRNAHYNSQEDVPRGYDWLSLRDGMCITREHYLTRAVTVLERISHPNIERVLVKYHHEDTFLAATGCANGGYLLSYLRNNQNANIARIALHLANALDYLHTPAPGKEYVVVHGDIHPTNVLMHNNEPILSNFALSGISPAPDGVHLIEPIHDDGHLTYKAPELLGGGARTPATDVYAFGMLLYAMISGQEPFCGMTPLGAAQQLLEGSRPLLPPGAPISSIVSSCWAATPAERWTLQQTPFLPMPAIGFASTDNPFPVCTERIRTSESGHVLAFSSPASLSLR